MSATVPVLAAQQHRATSIPAAIGPTQTDAAINVDPTSLTISESGPNGSFTMSLDASPGVTDEVTVPLSAPSGECTVPSSVTLNDGNWQGVNVDVTPVNDAVDDGPQDCIVETGPSNSTNLAYDNLDPADVTVTVNDNDTAGFDVSPTDLTITEGGPSGSFDVNLTSEPLENVTINLSPGSECTVDPTSLVFTSVNWDSPQNVDVTAVNDTIVDGDQQCLVTTSASSADGNYGGQPVPDVDVTVQDNDSATVSFAPPTGPTVNEDAGTIALTVQLSNQSTSNVSVHYQTSNGTATAGQDYTAQNADLTIPALSMSGTINIPILDDSLYEGNETFTVTLSNPSGAALTGPNPVTVTIIDGDPQPTVQFSSSTYAVGEGDIQAEITVSLSAPSAVTVTVTAATMSGGTATAGSDYTATTANLEFAPDETSKTFSVDINNDTLDEDNETVILGLSNASGATIGSPSSATLTIMDNDALPNVSFSNSSYTVGEGDGNRQITVLLNTASGREVTVGFATSDGSATAGSDYTVTTGTLTFEPGDTSETFNVPITNDNMHEPQEFLNLALSTPNNVVLGSPSTATLSIFDNDPEPTVEFSSSSYSVNEGDGSATITVVLSNPAASVVSVDYATSDGTATAGADYTTRNNTLVFSSGVITRTFTVPINDDLIDENEETVNLALSNPQGATLGTPSNSVLTIFDNDGITEIRFASATYTVTESAGTATINVVRSGLSSFPVSVDYETTGGGSATAGQDYTAVSGTLNFAPNETSKSFQVPILPDQINEPDETVNLRLLNPVLASLGSPSTAVLTIQDSNATPAVQFSQSTYTVDESMLTANITVTLNIAKAEEVTVFYAAQDGTATEGQDYGITAGTVVFPPGERVQTFDVTLFPDQLDEPDETVLLALSNPTGAVLGERTTASLIILDNDPTPALSFSLSSLTVGETDGTADLPVRLDAASGRTVTVDYTTIDGSAVAGSDYVAMSGTLTFSPGETTRIISVPIIEDLIGEPNETFVVQLSDPVNATLSTPDAVTVTIVDGKLTRFTRFFPVFFFNYSLGEPNDDCLEAYEIVPSRTYLFPPDDVFDWYHFTLTESGNLIVEVTDFVPLKGQLAVFKGDTCAERVLLGHVGDPGMNKTINAGFQEPGHYYIFVSNDGEPSLEAYRLRVRLE